MTDGPTTDRPITPVDAKLRRRVRVTLPDRPAYIAQLVYWPGDNRRRRKDDPTSPPSSRRSAVVLVPSGAYVRVPLDAVELSGDVES